MTKDELPPGVVDVMIEGGMGGPLPTLQEMLSQNRGLGVMQALQKIEQIKQLRVFATQAAAQAQLVLNNTLAAARLAAASPFTLVEATKPARQLYVGNLPVGVLGPQLAEFLGAAMQQMNLTLGMGSPVVGIWMSPDGRFALVDFRSLEEANRALALDKLPVGGGTMQLRVGRPKEYQEFYETLTKGGSAATAAGTGAGAVPTAPAVAGQATAAAALVAPTSAMPVIHTTGSAAGVVGTTPVQAQSHFLMLANVPNMLGELDVKALLDPFGKLMSFNMLKDKEGMSKGIAIFEYEDRAQAGLALKGLAGLDLGGKRLSIQEIPANQASMLLKPVTTASAGTGKPGEEGGGSAVIRLQNMLADDMDAEEVEEIKEEVTDECRKYGNVVSLVMDTAQGFIFVEFGDARASKRAQAKLEGRSFDGRTVKCRYYPLEAYKSKDLQAEPLPEEEPVVEGGEDAVSNAKEENAATADLPPAEVQEEGVERGEGETGAASGEGGGEEVEGDASPVAPPAPVEEDLD